MRRVVWWLLGAIVVLALGLLWRSATNAERLSELVIAGDINGVRMAAPFAVGVNAKGKYGLTPSQWARVYGRQTILNILEAHGADDRVPAQPPEVVVDAFFRDAIPADRPGAVVLVAKGGKILFEKGYGLADLERGSAITTETVFNLASITKPFTAAAILKLQEAGRLSLDDTVSKFIPDYPRGNEITIRHLLTHTSGIHDTLGSPGSLATARYPVSRDYVMALFKYAPLDFDPGAQYAYSNSAYYLLGYIIEKASGQTYLEYLKHEFFEPLGMSHTGIYQPGNAGKAQPYQYVDNRLDGAMRAKVIDPSRIGGNGALDSTARDLYHWADAYFSGRLLNGASVQDAITPSVHGRTATTRFRTGGYGFGWGIARFRGMREVFHTGASPGYCSALYEFPDEHFTVIILTNSSYPIPTFDVGNAIEMFAQLYLHDRMQMRDEPVPNPLVDPGRFAALVGRYDQGFNGVVTVTRDGKRLFAQTAGHPRIELFPKTETVFFYDPRILSAEVEFVKDQGGNVNGLIHYIGGDAFKAPRMVDVPPGHEALTAQASDAQRVIALSDAREKLLQPHVRSAAPIYALVIPMKGSYVLHGEAIELISNYLSSKRIAPTGPPFGRYFNSPSTTAESDLRWEIGVPVLEGTEAVAPFEVRKVNDTLVASDTVVGAHSDPKPWPELMQWIAKNGYVASGPTMETWLAGERTEMSVAIKRAE